MLPQKPTALYKLKFLRRSILKKIGQFIKNQWTDVKILLRNIPSLTITLFVVSVVCANLLANKELINYEYIALDCGFAFSWVMFLCMDIICKRWGAKASVKVSILALIINLAVCVIFFLLSKTPGHWGKFYDYSAIEHVTALQVDKSLNSTFGGSWYVVLGSATAFFTSSIVNAVINHLIAKHLKTDGFAAFALRSYISTLLAQFADNFIFATIVSKIFFGWTWTQVLICSVVAALFELLCEILFSGIGYKIVKNWETENVGSAYLEYKKSKHNDVF